MIVSASIIWKPRKPWFCNGCEKEQIEGPVVRLYGAAHHSDPPYMVKLHPKCINTSESKILKALEEIE